MVIIIPTCQRGELLERTLQCLVDSDVPESISRIVVIENGKKDRAEEKCKNFLKKLPLEYRYTSVGSKSHALNLILEECAGEFVVFFDDDVRIDPGCVRAYAEAASGKAGGEFFAGKCLVDYDVAPPEWLKQYLPFSAKGWGYGDKICELKEPLALGFNWAAFADDLKEAGLFDTSIGPGRLVSVGEEKALQENLFEQGVKGVYLPEALVWHHVPENRCSISWTLERNRKMALINGMMLSKKPLPARLVELVATGGKIIFYGAVSHLGKPFLSEAKQFYYKRRMFWNLGVLQGQGSGPEKK